MYKSHSRKTYEVPGICRIKNNTGKQFVFVWTGEKISPAKATANNINIPTKSKIEKKNIIIRRNSQHERNKSQYLSGTVFSKEQWGRYL